MSYGVTRPQKFKQHRIIFSAQYQHLKHEKNAAPQALWYNTPR